MLTSDVSFKSKGPPLRCTAEPPNKAGARTVRLGLEIPGCSRLCSPAALSAAAWSTRWWLIGWADRSGVSGGYHVRSKKTSCIKLPLEKYMLDPDAAVGLWALLRGARQRR